ncbi:unnamed protein product [Sympodiomycopsis kandeliae]
MAAPQVHDVAGSLNLENPSSYTKFGVTLRLSTSSGLIPKDLLGDIALYNLNFAIPAPEHEDQWPRLLLETNYSGGAWLQNAEALITPELAVRWSIFSFFTLIATSVGFPSGWTLRIGEDTTERTLSQE